MIKARVATVAIICAVLTAGVYGGWVPVRAQVIVYDAKEDVLEGGTDRRVGDGAAVGVPGRSPARPSAPERQR